MSKQQEMAAYVSYVRPIVAEAEAQLVAADGALPDPSPERNRIISVIQKVIDALNAARP